jgi:uncharacterized protein (DUF433 family)
MASTTVEYKYLVRKPNSAYRQLFVKDRWVAARTLYGLSVGEEAMTPEESAADYDLPLEAVQEAIAWCQSDPPDIAQDFEAEERIMEASGINEPDYKYHARPRAISPQQMVELSKP